MKTTIISFLGLSSSVQIFLLSQYYSMWANLVRPLRRFIYYTIGLGAVTNTVMPGTNVNLHLIRSYWPIPHCSDRQGTIPLEQLLPLAILPFVLSNARWQRQMLIFRYPKREGVMLNIVVRLELSQPTPWAFFSRADFETQAKVTERVNNVDNFERFDLLTRPFRLDVLLR